ncbi:MAG: serine/threonine-protein kinase, partial [Planctomycetota bacterium]
GRTVSHYRIEEKLGQGGMGVVYKAEDVRLKRPVALKFLPPHLVADLRAKERFLREAQAASALDHPNVGVVFDMDETDDGESFIAMAYYGGETVADKLEQGPLSVDDAVDFALQAARGLSRAHARGIVHRDVKPANLMVTDEGVLKILDFGLAKLAGAAHITGTGRALGTVAYMAPEQAAQDEATVQSDIWALGVVLYEMLSGRLPFRGGSPVAVLYHVLHEEPDPIRELRRETPAGLERVVARALAKDPSRRYQDLAEMVADLETVVSGSRGVGARIEPEPALGERSAAFERTSFSFPPLHPHVTDDTEFQVFVGRESELEQLDAWFQEALDGRGRVGFISGEAGCGKTVLAREFGRRATELDDRVTVATGRCNAHTGVGDPYHPFREILGLLTGDVEAQWSAGSLRADQATRLWSLVPSTVTALVEGGPELLGTIVPGAPLIARAQGHPGLQVGLLEDLRQLVDKSAAASSARQFDLFEQYVRVLRALAKERLLVLIVDDLQWADSGSVSLFFHLARELTGSRVLMLGLFRPSEVAVGRGGERHPFEPVLNEIKASFRDPEIRFGPTGDRQFVEALIDSEPNRLGPPFRASLFEQTRGHALFTVELLRGLEDQGLLLRDEEDRWMEHPHLEWDFLPARVEAVIEQRIGRLPPELQRILSIASVEGEEFTLEAVARAHGADTREILAPVSLELEKRHRLVTAVGFRRVDGQRLSVYRFRHILFQRYLYDHLDQVERALLHEHLGEALESLHGDAVDDI